MKNFTFQNPTKIIFGKGSMDLLKDNIKPYGKKVLLTYGQGSIKKNGIYDKVKKELKGFTVKEFGGIEPNPRVETIRKAVLLHKKYNPDFVLAVGGGSVIDGSKLLSSSLHYNGDPWDFLSKKNVEPKKYVPLGVILTIPATGSEMNSGSVISKWETHEKPYFSRDQLYPKFSILDPVNTFSLPKDQTAYGIVDAYSHILEQYLHTVKDTPLQDRFSESILLTLIENAKLVLKKPKDYEARANIMLSAAMALNDIVSMGTGEDWATHAIEHEFSAFYDISHGAGLAIITPRWMEEVRKQKMEKLAQYGKRIWGIKGNSETVSKKAITNTYNFFKSLGIKMSFGEWGIDSTHFPTIIKRLTKAKIGEYPLTEKQISNLLNQCI